jgi:hypothetical protein
MERRQAKAIKQLQTDADEERLQMEERKNELDVNKPLKRKIMADRQLETQHPDDTSCPTANDPSRPNRSQQTYPQMHHEPPETGQTS